MVTNLLLAYAIIITCEVCPVTTLAHKGLWFNYDFVPPSFIPLELRRKRAADGSDDDNADEAFRIPAGVEVENDAIDHKYYVLETFTNRSDMVKTHYFSVEEMLKKPGAVGNISHPSLSNSYRRAVAAKMQFEFPFYGFRMKNLTIATGGFSYVGDQSHSWLAAIQYIAPLMANFDTHAENSTIMYADDGEKFVIEWRNLQLRTQKLDGYFTFQVSLHKNGDIWFVYINIPIPVKNISDLHHPVKIGISDAYLFHHKTRTQENQPPIIKRIIHEYHRIDADPKSVTSNTVIRLIAQPSCIQYRSCEECSNASLPHFNCSWCHSKKEHGGPFCSDTFGLHRRRQHWLNANCNNVGKVTYCSAGDDYKEIDDEALTSSPQTPAPFNDPTIPKSSDQNVPWNKSEAKEINTIARESGSSLTTADSWRLLIVVLVILIACWFAYAYFNPQTASGQFLIRYRPSQWRMPSSHVRYSASVHM